LTACCKAWNSVAKTSYMIYPFRFFSFSNNQLCLHDRALLLPRLHVYHPVYMQHQSSLSETPMTGDTKGWYSNRFILVDKVIPLRPPRFGFQSQHPRTWPLRLDP
jgi:hypothetical protein